MTYKQGAGLIAAGVLFITVGIQRAEGADDQSVVATNGWRVASVQKIWDAGKHNAFTDLARFNGQWFCTFREADGHVGGDGVARVLMSHDGEKWESVAGVTEPGIDLRDPKFSVTPDKRLMMVMGGSVYEGKTFKGMQPRVSFSSDGRAWTKPQKVLKPGEWLWRVTWHDGTAYGISYSSGGAAEWTVKLVKSTDGIQFEEVQKLAVPGRPNEGTLRFLPNGECIALLRREAQDKHAWIGTSVAPYSDWKWNSSGMSIGGPNFILLPNGRMVASGRQTPVAPGGPKTFLGPMTRGGVTPAVILPSGGDTSYPGLVWHDGLVWVSYYSSHEGKSAIYLAKVEVLQR